MSDDNATTETIETNGTTNGASNGTPSSDLKPAEAAVDIQHKEDETAPHKKRTRGPRVKVTTPTAVTPPVEEPAGAASATPQEPVTTPQESAEAPPIAQNAETPPTPRGPAQPSPAPADENLRLRVKVWTDPWTGKRYLMPTAFMRDVKNGQPVSDVMLAYAMRDDDTKVVTLRAAEWNTLPFFYFQEDGPAPRASERPLDAVGVQGGR